MAIHPPGDSGGRAQLDPEGLPVPTCAWHPERRPVAACVHCGRTLCKECATRGPEGYRCPECPPASAGEAAEQGGRAARDPVAALTRLCGLVGLVPLIGAPAAVVAVGLAAAVHWRRPRAAPAVPSLVWSACLGLVGLAGTVVVGWLLWFSK